MKGPGRKIECRIAALEMEAATGRTRGEAISARQRSSTVWLKMKK
jgi:hypothetical protein